MPIVVTQGRWAPVTAGEYDRRTGTVAVNLTVVDEVHVRYGHARGLIVAAIIAHERAHVLAPSDAPRHLEERLARAAAAALAGPEVVEHIDAVLAGMWA